MGVSAEELQCITHTHKLTELISLRKQSQFKSPKTMRTFDWSGVCLEFLARSQSQLLSNNCAADVELYNTAPKGCTWTANIIEGGPHWPNVQSMSK